MTSQLNLEDIYTELNNLLEDVCSFLTTEAQNGTLSAKAKNEAEKLVSRSRQQVDIVTKLSSIQESTNSNYPYLEMLPGGGAEEPLSEYVDPEITDYYEPQHYEESYPPVDFEPINPPSLTPTANDDFCIYNDLPLSVIEEKAVKYGPLCRKERYLFIEQKKQYMAGLVGYWLLIYALNKKDQKPIQIINLLNYSAKSIEQRKDPTFEIYAENEKTHEFIARSIKDMEQWVVAINCKKHICTNGRNLPEIPVQTMPQEFQNSDRNSNQINSDSQNHESEEDIYASVEDFGKPEMLKKISAPTIEDFPKLPPRSLKEIPRSRNLSACNNTYNNLQKLETEVNDDDPNSEYDLVQCSDTQKQQHNEEEPLEIYHELKITETVNKNVRKPSFSNINIPQNNYDSVDTGQEELEDYDTVKPMSKIPIKMNVPPKNYEQEDEDMVDYDELKPICRPNHLKQTLNTEFHKDEDLEDYDELKPVLSKYKQFTQVTSENSSEEVLEDYDVLKPVTQSYQSKQNKPMTSTTLKVEELENNDIQQIQNKSNTAQITPFEDEELVEYDELKLIPFPKPNQSTDTLEQDKQLEDDNSNIELKSSKPAENMMKNNEMKSVKPSKPMKKFWEKRLSESPKKEIDTDDDESKRSFANIKTKFNGQSSISAQDKLKPPVTSPKPKSQMLLNKFPSFSKNKNSKDEDGNSKVQNIRQQLEHTLSFRSNK